MNIENLSTLKIHKLSQEQYDREKEAGRIEPNAIYLTPDEDTEIGNSVGVATEEGGEIFNNYEENVANKNAHAEGSKTEAIGENSHAEGDTTQAYKGASHAEGSMTIAGYMDGINTEIDYPDGELNPEGGSSSGGSGTSSEKNWGAHAEGLNTRALAMAAHAEGEMTKASGYASHSEGAGTVATAFGQHVQGRFNDVPDDMYRYADVVGGGTSHNDRKNIRTLDWDGNAWFAGKVTIGSDNKELATKEYVDSQAITVDTMLNNSSENPVQNKVLYGHVTVVGNMAAEAKSKANQAYTLAEQAAVKDIILTAENESAVLGTELATPTGWTSTGWTGNFASGFTHTSGNTNSLTFSIPGIAANKFYLIAFKSSVAPASKLTFTIGAAFNPDITSLGANVVNRIGIKAIDTGLLKFTPATDYTGTISNISIKEITADVAPYKTVYDHNDAVAIEFRSGVSADDNIFIGKDVGEKNISGVDNVAIGSPDTFKSNISGNYNTVLGPSAFMSNVNGSANTIIGKSACNKTTAANKNVVIGAYAALNVTDLEDTVAIGNEVMQSATGGTKGVFIGKGAGRAHTTGSYNVAIGFNAGQNTTTGSNNVFMGGTTGSGNTTGAGNVGLGYGTLQGNKTGNYNIALGTNTLYRGTAATGNIALGLGAMSGTSATTTGGNYNVAIGYQALRDSGNNGYNIAIGYTAGKTITTGNENIVIGNSCDVPSPTGHYQLNIGNLLKGSTKSDSAYLEVNGGLELNAIPTSDPLDAGRVWNDNGVLRVSTGTALTDDNKFVTKAELDAILAEIEETLAGLTERSV